MWKKTVLVTAITALLTGGAFTANAASSKFRDMDGHWSLESVGLAVEKGYVDGYEDNTFRPDKGVTRAEYLKMVVTANKLPITQKADGSEWFKPYYAAALEKGLITETEFPVDKLNLPIARVDMAKISVRAVNSKWHKQEMTEGEALYESTKVGLIQGMDDAGTLAPLGQTTRAQSVTSIERVLALQAGKTLPVDKYATSNAEIEWHKTNIFTVMPQYFLRDYLDHGRNVDVSKMRFEAENGYSEIEKIIAIDLDDPNDPNRALIPKNVRWKTLGVTPVIEGGIGEYPTGAYALLAFNKLVVDSPVDVRGFRTSSLLVNYKGESKELKDAGKPYKLGLFTEYLPENEFYVVAAVRNVKAGHNDINFVNGFFIPKGKLTVDQKDGLDRIAIYNQAAVELGQTVVHPLYSSRVDHSLSEE
ncbi:S-layer homology domain-containing protein [Paenibacillus sp. GYB003]|uniref:S-layer homology domain-containing protein n=1 Tax=Paenibacillus sp. GYB003 TaxID=2994392 RepID=UPI002F96AFD1